MKTLNVKDETAIRLTRCIGWLKMTYGKQITVDDTLNKIITDWLHSQNINEKCTGELE